MTLLNDGAYGTRALLDRAAMREVKTADDAEALYKELRAELYTDARGLPQAMFGMVCGWRQAGIINARDFALFVLQLDSTECPGHPCSAGWCAYCGNTKPPEKRGDVARILSERRDYVTGIDAEDTASVEDEETLGALGFTHFHHLGDVSQSLAEELGIESLELEQTHTIAEVREMVRQSAERAAALGSLAPYG